MEVSRGNFKRGKFARIRTRNSFYLPYFLVGEPILHQKILWRNCSGESFSIVTILWGIFTWGEILHGQIITRRNSPWGNFLREKLSIWAGGNFQEIFTRMGDSEHNLKNNQRLESF